MGCIPDFRIAIYLKAEKEPYKTHKAYKMTLKCLVCLYG